MRRTLYCGPFILAAMTLLVALTMPVRLCKAVPILYWDGTGTSWSTDSSWSTSSSATTPDPTGTIDRHLGPFQHHDGQHRANCESQWGAVGEWAGLQ